MVTKFMGMKSNIPTKIAMGILIIASAAALVVGTLSGEPRPSAHAATAFAHSPSGPAAVRAVSFLADLSPGALATAGVSGDVAAGLLASVAAASSDIASARVEHSLAHAVDTEVRAEIRRGGLTLERR